MPRRRNLRSRHTSLESPKTLYNNLIFCIDDNFGERQKDGFVYVFRRLPATILERGKPLVWFAELERRGELSPDNLSCLEDFFPYVSLDCLLKTLYDYQTKRRIIMFFQEGVQREIPTVCLDDIFNKPWTWKEQLPKNFLQKCQNLMSEACHSTSTVQVVSSLLSKAVTLLGKSCRPNANQDLKTTAAKILHVSNLFFQKYHVMILENKDMLHKVSSISLVQPTVNHVNSTLPKAVKEKGTSLCRRILEQFLSLLAAVISIFMVLITESRSCENRPLPPKRLS